MHACNTLHSVTCFHMNSHAMSVPARIVAMIARASHAHARENSSELAQQQQQQCAHMHKPVLRRCDAHISMSLHENQKFCEHLKRIVNYSLFIEWQNHFEWRISAANSELFALSLNSC